jgi:hypothetical protein
MPQRRSRGGPEAAIATNTYWRSLSDEELLRISFTTKDPESLAGLVEEVPDTGGGPPIVEYGYDFRGSKRSFIRCAHCGYPNHLAGYVIKTSGDIRFLVGHDCGDKIYGADFAGIRRDYENARNYADDLKRWRNLQAGFPAFFEYLIQLQRCAEVRAFRDKRATFRKAFPRLFGEIAIASDRHNGALHLEEKIRDFNAEARAEEFYERDLADWNSYRATEQKKLKREGYRKPVAPILPMYKMVPKVVMTVRASEFFSDQQLPHETLSTILRAFENLSADLASKSLQNAAWDGKRHGKHLKRLSRHTFATTYRETFRQANALLDQIETQLDVVDRFAAFFDPTTLAAVAQWANEHPSILANVVVRDRGLVAEWDSTVAVSLPPNFKAPDREPLNAFRRAVNTSELPPSGGGLGIA